MIELLLDRQITAFLFLAVHLILAISLHEFGHAAAATLQGDMTAKSMGRLTINPIRHLDPIGTLAIVFVGFGWGKPVPFNPKALRRQRSGPALVALAGPAINVILALIFEVAFLTLEPQSQQVARFLVMGFGINTLLAVFNLFPLPPLDGSRLLTLVIPPSKQRLLFFLDRWGFAILVLAMLFGVFRVVLDPVVEAAATALLRVAAAISP